MKGAGAILSQKFEKQVITYAIKGFFIVQKHFHPMEGECYAPIWGIMHFWQYFHLALFLLRIDHKPLDWLVIIFDAYGHRSGWISMLQDIHLKIVHCVGFKHANVDVLNINPVDKYKVDEDFGNEYKIWKGLFMMFPN